MTKLFLFTSLLALGACAHSPQKSENIVSDAQFSADFLDKPGKFRVLYPDGNESLMTVIGDGTFVGTWTDDKGDHRMTGPVTTRDDGAVCYASDEDSSYRACWTTGVQNADGGWKATDDKGSSVTIWPGSSDI